MKVGCEWEVREHQVQGVVLDLTGDLCCKDNPHAFNAVCLGSFLAQYETTV